MYSFLESIVYYVILWEILILIVWIKTEMKLLFVLWKARQVVM